jgi:hypothetical protein
MPDLSYSYIRPIEYIAPVCPWAAASSNHFSASMALR